MSYFSNRQIAPRSVLTIVTKSSLRLMAVLATALILSGEACAQVRFHKHLLKRNDVWLRSDEAQAIANHVIQYRSPQGNWPQSLTHSNSTLTLSRTP